MAGSVGAREWRLHRGASSPAVPASSQPSSPDLDKQRHLPIRLRPGAALDPLAFPLSPHSACRAVTFPSPTWGGGAAGLKLGFSRVLGAVSGGAPQRTPPDNTSPLPPPPGDAGVGGRVPAPRAQPHAAPGRPEPAAGALLPALQPQQQQTPAGAARPTGGGRRGGRRQVR